MLQQSHSRDDGIKQQRATKMEKYFAGIGSRKIPASLETDIAEVCQSIFEDFILRSGGADGADTMFERAFDLFGGKKEIYLPWKNFNNNNSSLYVQPSEAYYIASQNHGNWRNLKEPVRKLMARNVMQILGMDLKTPSSFVLVWTPDGCESHKTRTKLTGGSGLAIAIASKNDIPVFNMKNFFWKECLTEFLFSLKEQK